MVWVRSQAGIMYPQDLRSGFAPLRYTHSVGVVPVHPEGERLDPALQEPGGVRVQRRTPDTGVRPDRIDPLGTSHNRAGRDITVPAQVFGRTVDHEIGTVIECVDVH